MTTQLTLDPAITAHVAAINSFDIDAIMRTFSEDALVNDAAREFWGLDHIRAWVAKEMVGDHVTLEPLEVMDNDGLYAVRCKFDGDYDKTNLPNPLIMTNYLRVRGGKIVTLFIIKNNEPKY
jgi:predicted transcriptional regulator